MNTDEPNPIAPKPTTLGKHKFRSRLEARWAIFFEYHRLIHQWVYEPGVVYLPNGQKYTTDFLIKYGHSLLMIEVKPSEPTAETIETLASAHEVFLVRNRSPLILVYGDFFSGKIDDLTSINLAEPTKKVPLSRTFAASDEAYAAATAYRFDLLNTPSPFPAPFRQGSEEKFREAIRADNQRRRNLNNKRKRK